MDIPRNSRVIETVAIINENCASIFVDKVDEEDVHVTIVKSPKTKNQFFVVGYWGDLFWTIQQCYDEKDKALEQARINSMSTPTQECMVKLFEPPNSNFDKWPIVGIYRNGERIE